MVGGLTATYGLGSVILAPIARMMVENMGITSTFKILVSYLIVICGRIPDHPCPAGFVPEGYTPPARRYRDRRVGRQDLVSDDPRGSIFYVLFHHARMRCILRSDDDFPVFTGSTEYDRHGRLRQRRRSYLFSAICNAAGRGALRIYLPINSEESTLLAICWFSW